jgi:hypothetical protein
MVEIKVPEKLSTNEQSWAPLSAWDIVKSVILLKWAKPSRDGYCLE